MTNGEHTFDHTNDLVGRILDGRYVIEELIDRGGYCAIYRATDQKLNRPVALKIGLSSREFMREARFAMEVKHDHIVRVSDFGSDEGIAYLVMEFLEGDDLDKLFKKQGCRLTAEQLLKLVDEIGDALAFAHSVQLIHRDLKPRNIILIENGLQQDTAASDHKFVLLDFAIASKLDAIGTQRNHTWDGGGTLEYMAPEMRGKDPNPTVQSDIYSFGVILYQMMTGRVPFPQSDHSLLAQAEVLEAIGNVTPPSFHEIDPDRAYSFQIEELVMQCLEKDPNRRPKSMAEMRRRFKEICLQDRTHGASKSNESTHRTNRNISKTLRRAAIQPVVQDVVDELHEPRTGTTFHSRLWVWLLGSVVAIAIIAWAGINQVRTPKVVPYATVTDERGNIVGEGLPLVLIAGRSLTLTFAINNLPPQSVVEFETPVVPEVVLIEQTNGPIPGSSKNLKFSIRDPNSLVADLRPIRLNARVSGKSTRFESSIRLKIERPKSWLPTDLVNLGFREAPDSWRCVVGEKVFAAILDKSIKGKSVRFRLVPETTIGNRTINSFYVMEQMVTNAIFNDFANDEPGFEIEARKKNERRWEVERIADFPVTDVYALEAQRFVWWLTGTRYGALPSTTEWELAAGYWNFIFLLESKYTAVQDIDSELLRSLQPIRIRIPDLGAESWMGIGPSLSQFQGFHGELLKQRSPYGLEFVRLEDGRRPTEMTRTLTNDVLESDDLRVICQNGIPTLHDSRFAKNYRVILRGSGENGDDISWLKGQEVRRVKNVKDLSDDARTLALLPEETGRAIFTGFRVVIFTNVDQN